MAIFCTDESKEMVEKYKRFMHETMIKTAGEGGKDFLKKLKDNYSYIENYDELSFNDKVNLLWTDIYKCIQVAFDKHQNEDCTFDVELSVIDSEVATILTPMIFGDLFYYSRELKDYNELRFEVAKSPKDIVRELELGIYVTPEMEELRQKELAEIEEEEYKKDHTMVCPSCGDIAINQAPNGAGILESCDFYCACGWQEEQIGGEN